MVAGARLCCFCFCHSVFGINLFTRLRCCIVLLVITVVVYYHPGRGSIVCIDCSVSVATILAVVVAVQCLAYNNNIPTRKGENVEIGILIV